MLEGSELINILPKKYKNNAWRCLDQRIQNYIGEKNFDALCNILHNLNNTTDKKKFMFCFHHTFKEDMHKVMIHKYGRDESAAIFH